MRPDHGCALPDEAQAVLSFWFEGDEGVRLFSVLATPRAGF
ncbi:hypothetical protein [Caldimonas caldifontis]|nr:hypothetical protein [Caldimonas caldifontis]